MANKLSYEEALFKQALRTKVINGSHVMSENLRRNTKFLFSKQFPTQVLNTSVGRFIRVNKDDIHENTIDDLLATLLSIPQYAHFEGEEAEFEEKKLELLKEAIYTTDNLDYTDVANNTNLVEKDEFENIQNVKFNIAPQVIVKATAIPDETLDDGTVIYKDAADIDASKDTDMTADAEKLSSLIGSSDSMSSKRESSSEITYSAIQDLEQSLKDVESIERKTSFHRNESALTIKDLQKLQPKVNQLLKALKGSGSKTKRFTPSKKLSSKDMAADRDKVYVKKNAPKGKHIKLNLMIDMSGSMSGSPVRNAVKIVWLMNQLAKKGYVTMSVMYSEKSSRYKLDLPATDAEILALHRTGDSEGLAKTVKNFEQEIRGTNLICITDGNIVDEPIDKNFWAKNKMISTGVYVNKHLTDYTEYSNSLSKWFNHAIVRKSVDELVEWLVRIGLKG